LQASFGYVPDLILTCYGKAFRLIDIKSVEAAAYIFEVNGYLLI